MPALLLIIDGTNGPDTISVIRQGNFARVQVNDQVFQPPLFDVTGIAVNGFGGDDAVAIDTRNGSLGDVFVNGGSTAPGSDFDTLFVGGADSNNTFVLTFNAAQVSNGLGSTNVTFLSGSINNVEAFGRAGNDTLFASSVRNTPAFFRTQGGADVVNLIASTNGANDFVAAAGSVREGGDFELGFENVATVVVTGGTGNDSLTAPAGIPLAFNGNGGFDSLTITGNPAGPNSFDVLTSSGSTPGRVTYSTNGTSAAFSPSVRRVTVVGGNANDFFNVTPGDRLTNIVIDGQGGVNTIRVNPVTYMTPVDSSGRPLPNGDITFLVPAGPGGQVGGVDSNIDYRSIKVFQ